MKKKLLTILIIMLCLAHFSVAQQRYTDEVFTQVKVTQDVVYGKNYSFLSGSPVLTNLTMDVYEPEGDGNTARPLVVYLHTGSFLPIIVNGTPTGNLRDSATVAMCKDFAKRGYVAASVDYRVGWNPIGGTVDIRKGTLLQAVYRSLQDCKTAVRYFRMDAKLQGNTFKIDSNKIILAGQGSGGYVVLAYATLHDPAQIALLKFLSATTDANYGFVENEPYVNQAVLGDYDGLGGMEGINFSNWPGYGNSVSMVVNMGGALGDSTWLQPGNVPMVCFHVPNDPFAPYGNGTVIVPTTGQVVVDVSGSREVCRLANLYGNNDGFHIGYTDPYTTRANMVNEGFEGLFPFVLPDPGEPYHGQAGPWEWWSTADLEAFAPLVGATPALADLVAAGGLLTNPDMSKTKGLAYIDSMQGYLAPRIIAALQLPTGINMINSLQSGVQLYPNPATDHFLIQLDDASKKIQYLQLFDVTGRKVKEILNINSSSLQIDRGSLPTGMYMLKIGLNDKIVQGKLILE